jgi:hypothetical protein
LRGIASACRTYNDACREFILAAGEALIEEPGNGQFAHRPLGAPAPHQSAGAMSPGIQICRDRAEEHRAFAERASDPRVKSLLLELAEGYERIGSPGKPTPS